MKKKIDKRLVVVSNRLPIVIDEEEGNWRIAPGSGGLITALAPVMKKNRGLWIGWPGCGEEAPLQKLFEDFGKEQDYRLKGVPLTEEEVEKYYLGFSNETLWPLFHDLLGYCNFSLENWRTYQEVNRRFASIVAEESKDDDFIWVHDYQLTLVGGYLREEGIKQTLAFFLHIPFPSADLFSRLPWKIELLRGMMEYDLIGFQTLRDRRNFVNCAIAMLPEAEVVSRLRHYTLLRYGSRKVKVGHFPISIDFEEFNRGARTKAVEEAAWYLHENLQGRQLVLGIDRLDYTKGLPERFLAFERALEKYPEIRRKITLLQVVVPSRTLVPDYQNLKELLDQLAGRINARFAEQGWIPIHYVYRSLEPTQLLAHYRTSEIALITPLRDGMNLVAKEYCAASVDQNGVLILSEFAGAADQMGKAALLVNPYDIDGTADAIYRAFTMEPEDRRQRLSLLQTIIRRHDVHRWVNQFVSSMKGEEWRE
ncbi:trehalose-6-phosphate synthase [Desulfuromonas sp. TF]|uniref:alpha,alpha-trehalose-phosphate synthase (UDP-forming) n=1 Tax=Desulfuromonas sp. TF TaxID=1232410 RepID=UPI00040D696A|nr:trehalose-6-phosphate synthase [Desulfuromonas sp. TF]